ncbi:MAG: DegT/DnrJ/EryC1/StrS aminotransferase family protein [Magnetococcales bacterium]|nr:DegT/DnrJ/EryC1/StrS aminotransferase family protein [Magnetococcales bacterium]
MTAVPVPANATPPSDSPGSIPLYRLELTRGDEARVLQQLAREPFVDRALVEAWEGAWSDLWWRPACAFADSVDLIATLKKIYGWRSGDVVVADPLVNPIWREGLAAAWLHTAPVDIDPLTGLATEQSPLYPPEGGTPQARIVQHTLGHPHRIFRWETTVLEDVSAILKPLPGCGGGDLQMLSLDPNRMVRAGEGVVALSEDKNLIQTLKKHRPRLPAAGAVALGLSQLSRIDRILEGREHLAKNYLALRDRGLFHKPSNPQRGRAWDGFFLVMRSPEARESLKAFLNKSNILADSPLWFKSQVLDQLPGLEGFLATSLALPLYLPLTPREQKRVINRVHRWVEKRF